MRILIVDDNKAVRQGIRSLLHSLGGFSVCGEAADGAAAVEKARELRPDVVLMDVTMPHMDGLQASRTIRQELPEIKVIIVTQNDPAIVRRQAEQVQAHGFIGKADLARDLVPSLRRIFDGHAESSPTSAEPASLPWLAGGGDMGALMRATDWSKTSLGSPENWSPALRMMVKFLLANRFPQLLWWGPQFCSLYNDAYIPILGAKHPWAIGRPVSEVWAEIWHVLQPLIETPYRGGPATWMEDIPLEINRKGFVEETHFTIAYSPVPDDTVSTGIGGVLATVHEITGKVIAERRGSVLRDLGARTVELKSAEEACAIAAQTLSHHAKDIPFALLYLLDAKRERANLVSSAGIGENQHGAAQSPSQTIDLLSASPEEPWPVAAMVETEEVQLVQGLATKLRHVPAGPWSDPPRAAVVVPIRSNLSHQLAGFMIAGISARLEFDDNYRDFLQLISTQIATNIANARAYEEECKRAEALAEIDRAKTAFFSNVSHEFRTPLTLMLGPLQDLLSRSQTHLSPMAKEQLDLVNRNGARLLRLVNTLLDFSRIEAGRAQALFEATNLASFTSELASVFRSAMERAGLRLVVDCRDIGEPVYIDRDMWEKIVLNLLSNALKFTFEGEVVVTVRCESGVAELRIQDSGVGIPSEAMPKVFERFHRIENTRSRTHEGSGIGLALVQELVKLHGGDIRAESTVGQGSTFIVTIPLGQDHLPPGQLGGSRTLPSTTVGGTPFVEEALRWLPDAAPVPVEQLSSSDELTGIPCPSLARTGSAGGPEAARTRIVIADDNADMRQYLVRLFSEHYDVEVFPDGQAALTAARQRPPELILSDVMMPVLDGLGLLRELRADPRLKETPMILLSARAGEESRLEGLESGADDYLVKPFSARELIARVEAHIKMNRMRREANFREREILAESAAANAKFRAVFEQTTVFAGIMTNEGIVLDANKRSLEVCGYHSEEVLGKPFWETPWWRNFEESREKIRAATPMAAKGLPYRDRLQYSWADGSEHVVDLALYPIRDEEGRVLFLHPTGVDITDLQRVQESYRKLAETLEGEVRARTGELEKRNIDVLRQSELLRGFSQRLLQAQDEERRRIARELHDSAGQTLTILGFQEGELARKLKTTAPDLAKDIEEIRNLTLQLNQEIRTTSYLLHPPLLDEAGVSGALQWYVEGFNARSGVDMQLDIPKDFDRLPSEMELAIFRIVQEALTNIHRHSGSKKGSIRISRTASEVSLEIQDQGKGISPDKLAEIQSQGSGVGFSGMRERVHQLRGKLTVQSDSSGTRLTVVLPNAGVEQFPTEQYAVREARAIVN